MAGIGIAALPGDWTELAECTGLTDLFYPERGDDVTAAKAVCAGCPVKAECLEFAVVNGEAWGVWGGTSERERRRIRRERGITATRSPKPIEHGTDEGYQAHRRLAESPCDKCREAHAVAEREARERRSAA
jgi:WhiB family transcriptional regulator, redox-sensing transcriptional regulator